MVHSVLHSHTTAILPTLAPLPTPTAHHPHEPVMKASPPPTIPPRPQCPASQDPWGSAEEGSHLLGAQPTRRQSGGAMGRAEGKGRQKGRTSFFFFFYIIHREGCLRAGVPPRGHFPGTTRAQVPSLPFHSWIPIPPAPKRAPTLPRAGGQGSQVTERGLASPFLEGPRPLLSEGDGHLGNLSVQGSWGLRA